MKILQRSHLLENSQAILNSVQRTLSNKVNEITALKDTAHGWFKESLVVYFTTMLSDKQIAKVEEKLSLKEDEQLNVKLNLPTITNFNRYGQNAERVVGDALKHLVEDPILKSEKKFYYNAISIAKFIRNLYGGKVDPKRVDMGKDYDAIRSKAVELSKEMNISGVTADKWCAADIYIYNDMNVIREAQNAQFLSVDMDTTPSLNSLFQSEPTQISEGIFGVSLKEEVAQAGAATSFKNILSRKENYPKSEKINNRDSLSIVYHLENFRDEYPREKAKDTLSSKAYYFSNLAYAYASAINLIKRKSDSPETVKAAKDTMLFIESIFKSILGKNLPSKTGDKYDVNKIRVAFEKVKPSEFKSPSNIQQQIDRIASSVIKDAEKEYVSLRKAFLEDLKKAGYASPISMSTPSSMRSDIKRMLAKAGCYKTASYVLSGMSAGLLEIPKEFSTIAKQKNPFVAMVAYGVGMAGLSPTFFKIRGSSTGGDAHIETIYGSGYFHLDDKAEIKVIDKPTTSGFSVEFEAKVTKNASRTSKAIKRYKVIMIYHSAGDQITVLVNQLKGL